MNGALWLASISLLGAVLALESNKELLAAKLSPSSRSVYTTDDVTIKFIVALIMAFQDANFVYFVMECASGGDTYSLIKKNSPKLT